jgi:hypothetical protein
VGKVHSESQCSTGLWIGIRIGGVFFGFVHPEWMDSFKWWGNEISKQGCDWNAFSI